MANMKDVADRAGVSTTTVSHIINGSRYVSESLRTRVLEAIEALNYRPYGLARSLRTKRSRTVGVLIPDNTNPYFAEMTRQLENAFLDHGYSVIICNTEQDPERELRYLDLLREQAVDAMVFVSTGHDSEAIEELASQETVCVLLDRQIEMGGLDQIFSDNELGAYLATRHLIELGHRHIVCISGPSGIASTDDRLAGYHRAVGEAGIAAYVYPGDFRLESGYAAYRQFRAQEPAPTAVFASNDLMAFGVMHGAASDRLQVPRDLSVVGFDDIQMASYSVPALTTIRQAKNSLVEQTVERILTRLAAKDSQEPIREVLSPELVVRESTAAPEGHDAPDAHADPGDHEAPGGHATTEGHEPRGAHPDPGDHAALGDHEALGDHPDPHAGRRAAKTPTGENRRGDHA